MYKFFSVEFNGIWALSFVKFELHFKHAILSRKLHLKNDNSVSKMLGWYIVDTNITKFKHAIFIKELEKCDVP